MLLHQASQHLALTIVRDRRELHQPLVALPLQLFELVQNECNSTAHSSAEIAARAAEHDNGAAGHILAAVIADSFDHSDRAAVAHREALTRNAREKRLAGCRAIQHGVPNENSLIRDEIRGAWMAHDQASARKSLADVIVRFAFEAKRDAARDERAEALARRPEAAHANRVVR